MKNGWLVWFFIIGIIAVVLIAFNFHGNKDAVPLSEIFPDEETYPVDIEYEFVDNSQEEESPASDTIKTGEPSIEKTERAKEIISDIPVKVKKPAEKEVTALNEKIPFTVQVASFNDKGKAETKLAELKKAGYPAFIFSKNLGSKGIWYRVYVGKFNVVEEAEKLLIEIKKKYPDSFIISPR